MNSAVGKTDIYQCKIRDTKQEFKIKVELKKLDKEAPRLANFRSFHILFFFLEKNPCLHPPSSSIGLRELKC